MTPEGPSDVFPPTPPWSLPLSGRWAVWKDLVLRGTGFPVELLEPLSDAETSASLERLFAAEARVRSEAIALDRVLRDRDYTADPRVRREMNRALKALGQGKVPVRMPEDPRLPPRVESLRQAHEALAPLKARWREAYERGLLAANDHLVEISRRADFREAVLWQSPDMATQVLPRFPASDDHGGRAMCRRLAILRYLQRYTTKNDTIGYYGPVSWGRVSEETRGLAFTPGPGLVTARLAQFEHWAVDALATRLSEDLRLRMFLAPRLHPRVRVVNGWLRIPAGPMRKASPATLRLVALCDGKRSASAILRRLAGVDHGPAAKPWLRLMTRLARAKALVWRLDAPIDPWPEEILRRELEALPPSEVRSEALRDLEELVQARAEVAASRGDPPRLETALASLDGTFTRLTGVDPRRNAGKSYGGRCVLFEDCARDGSLAVGAELLRGAMPALDLYFRGAAWYLDEIGSRVRQVALEAHRSFQARTGRHLVPLSAVGKSVDAAQALLEGARGEVEQRWDRILAPAIARHGPGAHVIEVTAAELARDAAREFPLAPTVWSYSRFLAPDVMIAAESPDAVREGRGTIVVGESHLGFCHLVNTVFRKFHPEPERLDSQLLAERGGELFLRTAPRNYPATRTQIGVRHPSAVVIETTDLPSWQHGKGAVRLADLVVREAEDDLVVELRDGSHVGRLMEVLGPFAFKGTASCGLWSEAPHRPRLVVDGVVLARETWIVPASELPARPSLTGGGTRGAVERMADEMVALGRWRRDRGLPRHVFVRVAIEPKPFLLDFESPLSLEAFLRLSRKAESVIFSEMLPGPGDCWLTDAAGRRYTSELRLMVMDRRPVPVRGPRR